MMKFLGTSKLRHLINPNHNLNLNGYNPNSILNPNTTPLFPGFVVSGFDGTPY